jgi:hypothetical protein
MARELRHPSLAAAALVQLTALVEDVGNRHGVALIRLCALVFGHLAKDVQDEVLMPEPKPAELGLEGLLLFRLVQQPAITLTMNCHPTTGGRTTHANTGAGCVTAL